MTVDLMFYCNYNTDIGKVSAILKQYLSEVKFNVT